METFLADLRRQWAVFAELPWRKKPAHIWMYYRWHLVVIVALIALVSSIVTMVSYNSKEQLISGMFLNNAASQEGYAFVKEGYWQHRGADENSRVELIEGRMLHFDREMPSQEDAAAVTMLGGMISSRALDYVITDEATARYLEAQEAVMDLEQLLPEDLLDSCTAVAGENGIIALSLQDTAFQREYELYAPDSCILVIQNTRKGEELVEFIRYLYAFDG